MKLTRMFATAGLVIASLGVSATADAQGPRDRGHHDGPRGDHRGPGRHDIGRHDFGRDHRGPDYRGDRYYGRGHDRGHRGYRDDRRRYGYNGYGRSRCRVTWRNHRQVRVCR